MAVPLALFGEALDDVDVVFDDVSASEVLVEAVVAPVAGTIVVLAFAEVGENVEAETFIFTP